MGLKYQQRDHRYLLDCAERVLGVSVRAVSFGWEIQQRLEKQIRYVRCCGIDSPEPIVSIDMSRTGIDVEVGMVLYRVCDVHPQIDLVRVRSGACGCGYCPRYDFWAVPQVDYERLFQYARSLYRRATKQSPPVMHAVQQRRLWENTVGFLQQSLPVLRKYGVPQRRGVLLTGAPGNGKTMAARWLRHECHKHRLAWRTISADEYEEAIREHELRRLFHLSRPGIIQFDDLDQHLRDRNETGTSGGHMALLAELDGVEPRHGIVILFTSNAALNQLDPAIRRPGRIDQIIEFHRPDAELRRRLLVETWHADLLDAIDVRQVVRQTDGLSFAELDELKKLMVLGFLEGGEWDWAGAQAMFMESRQSKCRRIGFQHLPAPQADGMAALNISAER